MLELIGSISPVAVVVVAVVVVAVIIVAAVVLWRMMKK